MKKRMSKQESRRWWKDLERRMADDLDWQLAFCSTESERPDGDKNGDNALASTTETVTAESENTEKPGDF